jgi:Arc/MetJ family transcription regulator
MRTNFVINDDLLHDAINLTGIHTKRELVNLALRELVKNRKKRTELYRRGIPEET